MAENRKAHATRDRIDELRDEMLAEGQAWHDELDKKFTERANANRAAARAILQRLTRAVVVFGLGMSLMAGVTIHLNNRRADDIQTSRREASTLACLETNARHDNALIEFDKLLLHAIGVEPKTYPEKLPSAVRLDRFNRVLRDAFKRPDVQRRPQFQEIRQSAATTPLLINALVPQRDCVAYVRRLIK